MKNEMEKNEASAVGSGRIFRFLRDNRVLLILLAAGFLLRLAVALPGFQGDAGTHFSRPDSCGYLGPARALAVSGEYLSEPGGKPDFRRAPGFPFFAALVLRAAGPDNMAALAFSLVVVGALIPLVVYWAGAVWFDRKTALWACGFMAFNLTMIAQSPMLLSDTLFGLVAALMLFCYGKFYRQLDIRWFVVTLLLAGIGALIRPINSMWIFPALFLLAVTPKLRWVHKLAAGVSGLAVFLLVLLPWMGRNAALGAGWSIDSNTGAMYHQNGAMLLARVNHSSFEVEKAKLLAQLKREFSDKVKYPDQKSRTRYRLRKFRELIQAHPLAWIALHCRPQILIPDAPTVLELFGLTRAGRGTMDIMQRKGVFAAVHHYFGDKFWMLLPLVPLLLITLALYLLAAWKLGVWIFEFPTCWYSVLIFFAFAEYYFFLPGPIVAPRYQLPALPILALMAARQIPVLAEFFRKYGTKRIRIDF